MVELKTCHSSINSLVISAIKNINKYNNIKKLIDTAFMFAALRTWLSEYKYTI